MGRIYYLGSFPPPYGGVTRKNQLLYKLINAHCKLKTPIKKITPWTLIRPLFLGERFLIGSGSTGNLIKLTKLLAMFRPLAQKRSVVFVMGGSIADEIQDNTKAIRLFCKYRHLYIETNGMLKKFQAMGIRNVSLLPNCRPRAKKIYMPTETERKLQCVFFSKISYEKGADNIIETAKRIPNVQFHFYGGTDEKIEKYFEQSLKECSNVVYHGIFSDEDEAIYEELHKYDVLLLPTRWKNEGVPGILVEAKIAAIPSVVSDICYNSEIVENRVSGIVMKDNTVESLVDAIEELDHDRSLLYKLKSGAMESAERYYLDNYQKEIIDMLEEC